MKSQRLQFKYILYFLIILKVSFLILWSIQFLNIESLREYIFKNGVESKFIFNINLKRPSNDQEYIKYIEEELPSLPYEFMKRPTSGNLKINDSCAVLPKLIDLRYHNTYWQTFDVENMTFQIFGAYYDDRFGQPVIRLLTMVLGVEKEFPDVYCQMWLEEMAKPVVVKVKQFKMIWIKGWGATKDMYLPYLLECPLPAEAKKWIPKATSLVASTCQTAQNLLKISNSPNKKGVKKGFAVCVKNMNFPFEDHSSRLVEWLEMMRILGAEKVITHHFHEHPNMTKVLKYYQLQGFVEVHPFSLARGEPTLPYFDNMILKSNWHTTVLNEIIPYNDCFYKNMYKYEFIAAIDFDELIMPLGNLSSWSDLVESLKTPNKTSPCYVSYCFRNIYFPRYPNLKQNTSVEIPEFMYMLNHVWRVEQYNSVGNAVKCLHNTDFVLGLHNHYSILHKNGCRSLNVEPEIAQMQHYREPDNKTWLEYRVLDDNIWRFSKQLIQQTTKVDKMLDL